MFPIIKRLLRWLAFGLTSVVLLVALYFLGAWTFGNWASQPTRSPQNEHHIDIYSEFNLNQYSVASSLMYSMYTAVTVALS